MLPAPPLTLVECLIAADWCDEQGWSEYAERLRAMAVEPPISNQSSTCVSRSHTRSWTLVSSKSVTRRWVYGRVSSVSRSLHGERTRSVSLYRRMSVFGGSQTRSAHCSSAPTRLGDVWFSVSEPSNNE